MEGSILLISDIHADAGALEAILKLAEDDAFIGRFGKASGIINLGDVMERGYHPKETVDRMKGLPGLVSILGNHDEAFIYSRPVSSNDAESNHIHSMYRNRCGYESFFKNMPQYYIDRPNKLYVAHGGPIDPSTIYHGDIWEQEAWLHSYTWQRISITGHEFLDNTGYHYLPTSAFNAVRHAFNSSGYVIICGHEHREAAYMEKDSAVVDILQSLENRSFNSCGRRIDEKVIDIDETANYLIRLGIGGPEGYYKRYGWDRCHFGVYYKKDDKRAVSLLNFQLGRDLVPPC